VTSALVPFREPATPDALITTTRHPS